MKKRTIRGKIAYGLRLINVPHYLCDHIFNRRHTESHRITVGAITAFFGVCISFILHFEHTVVNQLVHYVGYAIHGAGLVPAFEYLARQGAEDV